MFVNNNVKFNNIILYWQSYDICEVNPLSNIKYDLNKIYIVFFQQIEFIGCCS